jgi:hypothetical protein
MYTKFKTYDTANADNDTTISDVTDLGSAAYLESQHLSGSTPWKPTDTWLYKFGVQDGNLVLTLVLSGYARTESEWPTSEKALQDQLQSAVKQILQKLAA